jgi:CheY-like chemotaxis protein
MRCLIVDDNVAFLHAAGALLSGERIEVAGTASTTAEALSRTADLKPDVILLDIDLGAESGVELARLLATADGAPPNVILISTHAEDEFADLIADTPAVGFLTKTEISGAAIRALLGRAARAETDPRADAPRARR